MIFVAAGVTDVLDGYFARKWGEQSTFGRMLDPIADKLLVASCLLMLAADGTIRGWSLWAAIVILCREILVSGLREYLAELRVSVPVTQLAKWKTTLQLVAVGFLIAGDAGDAIAAGGDPDRPRPALALGAADAVHWLGLFPCRRAAPDRGMSVKLRYFAWVRERIGKPEEEIDPPAGIATVADLMHWLSSRGEEYAARLREPEGDPGGDRSRPCASRRRDLGRARDRLLPADDRRLARPDGAPPVRLQREPFDAAAEAARLTRVAHRRRRGRHLHRHLPRRGGGRAARSP